VYISRITLNIVIELLYISLVYYSKNILFTHL